MGVCANSAAVSTVLYTSPGAVVCRLWLDVSVRPHVKHFQPPILIQIRRRRNLKSSRKLDGGIFLSVAQQNSSVGQHIGSTVIVEIRQQQVRCVNPSPPLPTQGGQNDDLATLDDSWHSMKLVADIFGLA